MCGGRKSWGDGDNRRSCLYFPRIRDKASYTDHYLFFFHVGRESLGDGENNEKYVVYFPWISDRLGLTDNAERFDRSLFRNILIFRDRAL